MARKRIVRLEECEGKKISLMTKQLTNHFHAAVEAITRGQSIYLGLDFICLKGVELKFADSEQLFRFTMIAGNCCVAISVLLQSKLINLHICLCASPTSRLNCHSDTVVLVVIPESLITLYRPTGSESKSMD